MYLTSPVIEFPPVTDIPVIPPTDAPAEEAIEKEKEANARENEVKLQNKKAIELLFSLGLDKKSIAEKLGLNLNDF